MYKRKDPGNAIFEDIKSRIEFILYLVDHTSINICI